MWDFSKLSEEELLVLAAALAIYLAQGREKREISSIINFLNLVAANLEVGLNQRLIVREQPGGDFFLPIL